MTGYARGLMEINAQALKDNAKILKKLAGKAGFIAVIKANAYGHGLVNIATLLDSVVDGFGVACVEEALTLRKKGIQSKILVLEGAFAAKDYEVAQQFHLDMVMHQKYQYLWWKHTTFKQPIHIWLKVNTGMNRLGFEPWQIPSLLYELQEASSVQSTILMSHLARADELTHDFTRLQQQVFEQCQPLTKLDNITYSLANSAGLLKWPTLHYDWVRAGLALYGISPFENAIAQHHGLQPVMTLRAKIIAIQTVQAGDWIGYYGRIRSIKTMCIGVVSFGYGDGYPYEAPSGTPVLFKGRRLPIVGQVSMDMLTIDLSNALDAKVGDVVTLWGEGLPLEMIAQVSNRSCYELLCGVQRYLSPRLGMEIT